MLTLDSKISCLFTIQNQLLILLFKKDAGKGVNLDFENRQTGEFFEGLNYTVRPSDTADNKVVTVAYDENQFVVGGDQFIYDVTVEPYAVNATTAAAASSSTELQLVNTSTLQVGHVVSGTGISGTPQISAINSPTKVTLTTAQSVANNTNLTFTANKFNLFAQVQPTLTLYRGNTYIFHHPSGHPIRFSTTNDGTHGAGGAAYTTGVVTDTTTTTGQVNGAVSNSTSVTLTASNTNIKVGDVVTATGINTTVAAIDGVSLTLSEAKTIANGTALTFTTSRTLFSPVENTPENMFYYCEFRGPLGGPFIFSSGPPSAPKNNFLYSGGEQ